jgi:hypothetical protein
MINLYSIAKEVGMIKKEIDEFETVEDLIKEIIKKIPNREKYSNVDIIDAGFIGDISATKLREAIKTRNRLAIKSLIPEGIKVNDFLMNFQIHEIKVINPNTLPSYLLPIKDKIDFYIESSSSISDNLKITSNLISVILGAWYSKLPEKFDPTNIEDTKKLMQDITKYVNLTRKLKEDKIPSGLSQGKTLQDIIHHHGKDSWASIQWESLEAQLKKQLEKSIKVEMEHTTSKEVAREIAMDHLWEDPKYYDKLASIEERIDYHARLVAMAKRKDPDRLTSLGKEYLPENDLEESKNLGDLYHFTSIESAASILKSNQLRSSYVPKKEYERDFQSFGRERGERLKQSPGEGAYYISFTRDKLLYKKTPKIAGSSIRFTVDGTKLSSTYKIVPFFYYKDELMDDNDRHRYNENEERIISNVDINGLKDFKKYLTKTELILDVLEDNETYINRAKQLKQFYPDLITLYKEKPMSIEEYVEKIVPTIEPYRDAELDEAASKVLDKILGRKLNEDIQVNPDLYIELLNKCAKECCEELKIPIPKIEIINDSSYTDEHKSYASYNPSNGNIQLVIYGRDCMSSVRSLSHEIFHHKDNIDGNLTSNSGKDGDDFENRANSYSGKTCRWFGRKYPEAFFLRYE